MKFFCEKFFSNRWRLRSFWEEAIFINAADRPIDATSVFVNRRQQASSSTPVTSACNFYAAFLKTLPEPRQGRNESTLMSGTRCFPTFQRADLFSSQEFDCQMQFGHSTRKFCRSIRSSRHKRNSRHSVFTCPGFLPETRPRCGPFAVDDGVTH